MEEDTSKQSKFLNDAIDDLLDLPVEEKIDNTPPTEDAKPTSTTDIDVVDVVKKNVVSGSLSTPPSLRAESDYIKERSQDIRDDYNQARNTLQDVLHEGKEALTYLINLAKGTDKYEYFDSIAKMMKELTDTASKLMANQEVKNELDVAVDGEHNQPSTVNNNLFIGSTKELLDMLKKNNG